MLKSSDRSLTLKSFIGLACRVGAFFYFYFVAGVYDDNRCAAPSTFFVLERDFNFYGLFHFSSPFPQGVLVYFSPAEHVQVLGDFF